MLTRGTDLPVLSWTMKDGANFTVFELSEALRAYGWQVPAYTMPANLTDLAICRIVVRHGMRMDLSNLFLDDMREVMERFAAQPPDRTARPHRPGRLQPRVAPGGGPPPARLVDRPAVRDRVGGVRARRVPVRRRARQPDRRRDLLLRRIALLHERRGPAARPGAVERGVARPPGHRGPVRRNPLLQLDHPRGPQRRARHPGADPPGLGAGRGGVDLLPRRQLRRDRRHLRQPVVPAARRHPLADRDAEHGRARSSSASRRSRRSSSPTPARC